MVWSFSKKLIMKTLSQSQKTEAITLPTDAVCLNFLGGGVPECFLCLLWDLDSGSKWWTHVSTWVTNLLKKFAGSLTIPVPEMSATGLAYAADICGLPRKSLRKLAYVRRCPLQIRRCPCLCQSLRTFADIFPYQLGLSFCGRPQLYAS